MSLVTVNVPNAPDPLACMRRSGMTSRSKFASFSRYQTSCSSIGPRGPAVIEFWLSGTGAPTLVVSFLSAMAIAFPSWSAARCESHAWATGFMPERTREPTPEGVGSRL